MALYGLKPDRPARERLGVTLQTAGLSDVKTFAEMVTLQSGYYSDPRPLREALALARLEDWPSAAAALCRAARRGRCDPRSRSAIELAVDGRIVRLVVSDDGIGRNFAKSLEAPACANACPWPVALLASYRRRLACGWSRRSRRKPRRGDQDRLRRESGTGTRRNRGLARPRADMTMHRRLQGAVSHRRRLRLCSDQDQALLGPGGPVTGQPGEGWTGTDRFPPAIQS